MKNNVEYYRHYAGADQHPKFKMLRNEYGWAGEGKFWALNNRIAQSENCCLDISKKYNKASVANDLDFKMEEFEEFVRFLIEDCELLNNTDAGLTTDIIQENYLAVSKKRKKNHEGYARAQNNVENDEIDEQDVEENMLEDDEKQDSADFSDSNPVETDIQITETQIQMSENIQSKSKSKLKEKEKRKVNQKKKPPDFVFYVLEDLNRRLDLRKGYSPFSKKNQSLILARQKEGFTLTDFIAVNEKKIFQWKNDPEMARFLRPETLYGNKFEGYVNEIVVTDADRLKFERKRKPTRADKLESAFQELENEYGNKERGRSDIEIADFNIYDTGRSIKRVN